MDDIAIVKSMVTDAFNHAPAQIFALTGSQQFGRPSVGAWVTYGLGSGVEGSARLRRLLQRREGAERRQLVLGSRLPAVVATPARSSAPPATPCCSSRTRPASTRDMQKDSLDAIKALNQKRLGVVGDPEIAARISAYEMAGRMQASAPELMDLSKESKKTLDMYGAEPGKPSFANNCLLARRLIERGVRFVQLFHEAWDHHGGLTSGLKSRVRQDRPGLAPRS